MAQYTETCGLQPTRSNPSRKQPGSSSSTWTIVRRSMNTGQDEEPPTSPGGREETRRSSAFSEDEPRKQLLKTEQPSEIQADETRLSDPRYRKDKTTAFNQSNKLRLSCMKHLTSLKIRVSLKM
ncbi:unnamed protein product [Brassica rapa]|uniref:BnaA03g49410D protein n=2 Tax=Brassica TaxID=3705 RepID=A0A078GYJ8_BRANA|nr:unnamed protein product [Brassica rapa]CDY30229.1 BnaA03g49410D [Brassica napus]VDC83724.1 unnamed protein product [Brassica rapa]